MMKYIGYIEICVGLGLGLGPIMSAAVIKSLGYKGTMLLFGGLMFTGGIVAQLLLPSELNVTLTEEEQAALEEEAEREEDDLALHKGVKWMDMLCNP